MLADCAGNAFSSTVLASVLCGALAHWSRCIDIAHKKEIPDDLAAGLAEGAPAPALKRRKVTQPCFTQAHADCVAKAMRQEGVEDQDVFASIRGYACTCQLCGIKGASCEAWLGRTICGVCWSLSDKGKNVHTGFAVKSLQRRAMMLLNESYKRLECRPRTSRWTFRGKTLMFSTVKTCNNEAEHAVRFIGLKNCG